MPRYAILDIGTNSMKYLLADCEDNNINVLREELNISRLGEGLQETGVIPYDVMDRNLQAIKEFSQISEENEVNTFYVFSTAVLRRAENAETFIQLVLKETGIPIQVISVEEEANLAYEAVVGRLKHEDDDYMIFDIGGGSTEFIVSGVDGIKDRYSLPVGALVITDRFMKTDPPQQEEIITTEAFLQTILQKHFNFSDINTILAIGGTVTTLAAVKLGLENYDARSVDGLILTKNDVDSMIKYFAGMSLEQRRGIGGLHPERADIILSGTLIVKAIMDVVGMEKMTVCDCGVRHGMLNTLIKRNTAIE
jgi:exopolyphosphatase/guanosine-5'-triphosphate,3'-diphosphate pyrophosphatase